MKYKESCKFVPIGIQTLYKNKLPCGGFDSVPRSKKWMGCSTCKSTFVVHDPLFPWYKQNYNTATYITNYGYTPGFNFELTEAANGVEFPPLEQHWHPDRDKWSGGNPDKCPRWPRSHLAWQFNT